METMIVQKRLRSLGHVRRMDDGRIPKAIFFSETRDAPLLRYLDNCKRDRKLFDMNLESWEEYAIQRSFWKEKVTMRAKRYEQALIQKKEENRTRRKQLLPNLNANNDAFL